MLCTAKHLRNTKPPSEREAEDGRRLRKKHCYWYNPFFRIVRTNQKTYFYTKVWSVQGEAPHRKEEK